MSLGTPALNVADATALLHSSGLASTWPAWTLEPISNHRLDPAVRQQFVVRAGDPVAFLTTGPDLEEHVTHVRRFTERYPSLSPATLGRVRHAGRDLLLQEFVSGRPLLDAFPGEPERITATLAEIDRQFTAQLVTSHAEAALDELEQLAQAWLAIPFWHEVERDHFRTTLLPCLHRLVPPSPQKRMSNGDFLSRNILVHPGGRVVVIDHENAAATHFYDEDWIRFGWWDPLPAPVRTFVDARVGPRPEWIVYFAVRQLVLEARHHRPRRFKLDACRWRQVITEALRQVPGIDPSRAAWPAGGTPADWEVGVQLFWEDDLGWREAASQLVEIPSGRHRVTFSPPADATIRNLRLDPLDLPGRALIESVSVVHEPTGARIWEAAGPALDRLTPGGDARREAAASSAGLPLISEGNDPQLYFPPLPGPLPSPLRVEVTLTVSLRDDSARPPLPQR